MPAVGLKPTRRRARNHSNAHARTRAHNQVVSLDDKARPGLPHPTPSPPDRACPHGQLARLRISRNRPARTTGAGWPVQPEPAGPHRVRHPRTRVAYVHGCVACTWAGRPILGCRPAGPRQGRRRRHDAACHCACVSPHHHCRGNRHYSVLNGTPLVIPWVTGVPVQAWQVELFKVQRSV